MTYNYAWIASMASVYIALFAAPLVLGSWVMLQRTGVAGSAVWLVLLALILLGGLAAGAAGLYLMDLLPLAAMRGA